MSKGKSQSTGSAYPITEKQFSQQIIDYARLMGWMVYHTFDSRRSEPGWPDLFLVHTEKHKSLALEVKREEGKLTQSQCEWLKALQAGSIPAYVVKPSDWDKIVEWLE